MERAYVEIDIDIIKNNIKEIIKKNPDYKYYIGVIKGYAYGHGEYISVPLVEAGINYLTVSSIEEMLRVRKYVDTPILCLEPISIDNINVAIENNMAITVSNMEYYNNLLKVPHNGLKIHIKVDSGLNRLGFKTSTEIEKIYNELLDNKEIELEGIYTHYATTGYEDPLYIKQVNKFKELTKNIDLTKIKIVHLSRGCTMEYHERQPFENGVRLGVPMFGLGRELEPYQGIIGVTKRLKHYYLEKKYHLEKPTKDILDIKTSFNLISTITEIKNVKKGDTVGYEGTYKVKENEIIGICPIGCADGINSEYKNSSVMINHNKYPIIEVYMCMITIKIDDTVKLNDKVEIINSELGIKYIAKKINDRPYKVMTNINPLVPRIYTSNGTTIYKEKI